MLYPGLHCFNSNASCQYFVTSSFLLAAIFACCGHAISQIQIFFLSLSSNTKSGLPDVVGFCKLSSKSQTNLALLFSKTCPFAQFSSYHFVSFPTNLYSFAHAIAITINALLCRALYSLLAIVLHPATRCSTVSLNSQHSRHLPFSISSLATFILLSAPSAQSLSLLMLSFFVSISALTKDGIPVLVFFINHFVILSVRKFLSFSFLHLSSILPSPCSMLVSILILVLLPLILHYSIQMLMSYQLPSLLLMLCQ